MLCCAVLLLQVIAAGCPIDPYSATKDFGCSRLQTPSGCYQPCSNTWHHFVPLSLMLCCAVLLLQVIAAGCPINHYSGTKGGGCTPLVLAASKGQTKVS
jgi:hypothetical protein